MKELSPKHLISVVMGARNSEKTIETAIASIRNQTYKNIELLVVDDNSTDSTLEIVKRIAEEDPRVKPFALPFDDPNRFDPKLNRNVNAGYMAKNYAFDRVEGDLITIQDADDVSLLNRLEVQEELMSSFNATHVCTGLMPYDERLIGTTLDISPYKPYRPSWRPDDLYRLSQKYKGIIAKLSPAFYRFVPFHIKRLRAINKLFFGSILAYPGGGSNLLFKREVLDHIRMRPLNERVWPSYMGRGTDRDLNFQIVEKYKNSYIFDIPLFMWSRYTAD